MKRRSFLAALAGVVVAPVAMVRALAPREDEVFDVPQEWIEVDHGNWKTYEITLTEEEAALILDYLG